MVRSARNREKPQGPVIASVLVERREEYATHRGSTEVNEIASRALGEIADIVGDTSTESPREGALRVMPRLQQR